VCREAGSVYIGELTGSDGTFMMTRIISTVFNPDTINWDEFLGVNKAGDGNDEKRQATA
jgi:hypothetical protein